MSNEFTKPNSVSPAVLGQLANPDDYNQNIGAISSESIVGIDSNGNYSDVDLGDESLIANGALIKDIKLREGYSFKIYNSSGVEINNTDFADLLAPIGSVQAFAMTTPPTGWLECDGSEISRVTYNKLFLKISTIWGAGDGSTTFNIPDLRGEFIRGWDNGRGADSGRSIASYQAWAIENITGGQNGLAWRTGNVGSGGTGAFQAYTSGGAGANTFDAPNSAHIDFDASRVVNTSTETRPRNIALMYCIKF